MSVEPPPLPSFEQNKAQRKPGQTVGLEQSKHTPLWRIENERNIATPALVLDYGACHGPIFKVVTTPQALPEHGIALRGSIFGRRGHSQRHISPGQLFERSGDTYSPADTAFAAKWVGIDFVEKTPQAVEQQTPVLIHNKIF